MPLYEYECKKCGHRFERIQRFSDPMVKKCPECGGKVEQMISAPAVQFKGSGWYVTDFRDGSKKSGKAVNGEAAAKEGGEAAAAGESTAAKNGEAASGDAKPSDAAAKPAEAAPAPVAAPAPPPPDKGRA